MKKQIIGLIALAVLLIASCGDPGSVRKGGETPDPYGTRTPTPDPYGTKTPRPDGTRTPSPTPCEVRPC